jgi:hypothetical protein
VRIAEVVERLTDITSWARRTDSRLGFFAALYRTVTIEVEQGIKAGRFEDPERMERLDVLFARRYLDAFETYQSGKPVPRSWRVAFDASTRWRPIILQHLLLGMNAHINLDLGIAAATVAPGEMLPSLRRDFDEINAILAGLVAAVEAEISAVSPWIHLLSTIGGRVDNVLVNFNVDVARRVAWDVATSHAPLDAAGRQAHLERVDLAAALLGRAILQPPALMTTAGLLAIRGRETNTTARVIDMLMDVHPLPYAEMRNETTFTPAL